MIKNLNLIWLSIIESICSVRSNLCWKMFIGSAILIWCMEIKWHGSSIHTSPMPISIFQLRINWVHIFFFIPGVQNWQFIEFLISHIFTYESLPALQFQTPSNFPLISSTTFSLDNVRPLHFMKLQQSAPATRSENSNKRTGYQPQVDFEIRWQ